jgi:hypothetical protein
MSVDNFNRNVNSIKPNRIVNRYNRATNWVKYSDIKYQ